jgi:hypothetical protein
MDQAGAAAIHAANTASVRFFNVILSLLDSSRLDPVYRFPRN